MGVDARGCLLGSTRKEEYIIVTGEADPACITLHNVVHVVTGTPKSPFRVRDRSGATIRIHLIYVNK